MTTTSKDLAQLAINTIRTLSMDGVEAAGCGHPGTPDGSSASNLPIVERGATLRPVRAAMAQPRSLCVVVRSCFDANLLDATPYRRT